MIKAFFKKGISLICIGIILYDLLSIGAYLQSSFTEKQYYKALAAKMESDVRADESISVEAKSINQDIIGWIKIVGTHINYPILQANDNTYYLNHSFDKGLSKAGSIYMDYRNDKNFRSQNTILYGHNMKDGSMFADLKKFKKEAFIHENNIIYVNKNDDILIYKIFAVYVTDPDFEYRKPAYDNAWEFEEFLNQVMALSSVQTDQIITKEDKILTLSTCESSGRRLVVHAKRIN